jgi:hypothetical protein
LRTPAAGRRGLSRGDAYEYSGWTANLDLEELTPQIISKDGSMGYEPEEKIMIEVSD